MALITQTSGAIGSPTPTLVARVTLTASDTLVYNQGTGQKLYFFNSTGSPVTINLVGSAPTNVAIPRYGIFSTASGKSVTVPANGNLILSLDDIAMYLTPNGGTVTVTNGTGLAAYLWN